MSLTWADVDYCTSDLEPIISKFSADTKAKGNFDLNDLYKGLLDTRNSQMPAYTEEDLLVTKNLQTGALFFTLNEEIKKKRLVLEECYSQLEIVREARGKVTKVMNSLQKVYTTTITEGVENFTIFNTKVNEYFHLNEKHTIHTMENKISKLCGEISTLLNKRTSMLSFIIPGINHLVKEENKCKKICPLCIKNEVSIANVPCGHIFCKECINSEDDRRGRENCKQCNAYVYSTLKIRFALE